MNQTMKNLKIKFVLLMLWCYNQSSGEFILNQGVVFKNLCEEVFQLSEFKIFFNLFENFNEVLELILFEFDVKIVEFNKNLKIRGNVKNLNLVKNVFDLMLKVVKYEKKIDLNYVKSLIFFVKSGKLKSDFFDLRICLNNRKEVVLIKNFSQMFYLKAIKQNAITFGVGPAGTGKTYLAVAMAALALKNRTYSRVIFTRPVLEAGENLGFLPGNLQNKVDPYLRPLYDAMCDFIGIDSFNKYLERGIVEVLPLAYMRGRSLNDSFIVLDEAQNTTSNQMKMFLTRMGYNSKMVVTGDLTQVDLPSQVNSGLKIAHKMLDGVENIAVVNFEKSDIVRNKLVKTILEIYDKNNLN